jgi:hypothetical protein
VEGEWPFIKGFLEGLIPLPIERDVLRAWIQLSWKSLQNEPGYWSPGPVLSVTGPTRNGKSSLLKKILAPIFGKWADPSKRPSGRSQSEKARCAFRLRGSVSSFSQPGPFKCLPQAIRSDINNRVSM